MKNKVIIIITFIVITAGVLIYCNKSRLSEYLFHKIDIQLDYERSQEVGEDFNKINWGDLTFQINHHKDGNNLEYVKTDTKEIIVLLKTISSYKIEDGNLYIKSDGGYAVVNGNNVCRIYINSTNNEKTESYVEDKYGNKLYFGIRINDTNIQYLSSYEDFTESEKIIFKKMI